MLHTATPGSDLVHNVGEYNLECMPVFRFMWVRGIAQSEIAVRMSMLYDSIRTINPEPLIEMILMTTKTGVYSPSPEAVKKRKAMDDNLVERQKKKAKKRRDTLCFLSRSFSLVG